MVVFHIKDLSLHFKTPVKSASYVEVPGGNSTQAEIILHHLSMKYEPITMKIIINIHCRAIVIKILI